MSYLNEGEGLEPFENLTPRNLCFECGEQIEAGRVRYDGFSEPGLIKSIYLHPTCAALVGQRLISDGFPNRHRGS